MIVFVSGSPMVAIRDKKEMVSRCEVMVSGMKENGEPMRSLYKVRAGNRLAVSSAKIALTASKRVDPAAVSLMGMALGQEDKPNDQRTPEAASALDTIDLPPSLTVREFYADRASM